MIVPRSVIVIVLLAAVNKSSWDEFIPSFEQTVKTDVWDAEVAPFMGNRFLW